MKILKAGEVVSFRLQVINFQLRYGTKAAQEAHKISRATIFRWKKRLKEANFDVETLMDKSKVPKKKRKREVPKEIEDFIIEYRERHPGVGKETIKYNLDFFCEGKGIKKISESTVGRAVKDLKEKGKILDKRKKLSLDGRTGNLYERKKKNRRKKLRLKGYKPEGPGDLVQIDSITKFVNGIKRYI